MRRCFIHVGTHRTATTSLQQFLSTHCDDLKKHNYLYPLSGRPTDLPGHHNIAWEISNDDRFRKENGSIDDLLAEIAGLDHDVILSSEDFECSAHHAERFAAFVERLKRHEWQVTFVVYFRNQIDYAKSLYAALLLFNLDIPFGKFIEEILQHGQFRWRQWNFLFDYDELMRRLQSVGGVATVVRSYDELKQDGIQADFLSILGLGPDDVAVDESIRDNERQTNAATLNRFYQNCVRRSVKRIERAALAMLFRVDGERIDMNAQSKLKLAENFAVSNGRVFQSHGISEFACMRPEKIKLESGTPMSLENIFTSELPGIVQERVQLMNVYGLESL